MEAIFGAPRASLPVARAYASNFHPDCHWSAPSKRHYRCGILTLSLWWTLSGSGRIFNRLLAAFDASRFRLPRPNSLSRAIFNVLRHTGRMNTYTQFYSLAEPGTLLFATSHLQNHKAFKDGIPRNMDRLFLKYHYYMFVDRIFITILADITYPQYRHRESIALIS